MPALLLCSDSPPRQPRAAAARSRRCRAGGTATACCQGPDHGSHLPVCCPRWGHGGESVGIRRSLVGTAQRGEGLYHRGPGTVELGMLHEWLDLAVESRVEEGATDGEAWEEPGRSPQQKAARSLPAAGRG